MNGFERINAALQGQWPDKRPILLHNFMLAAREAGFSMKEYRDDPEKAAKSHIQFVEKYNVDGILLDVDTAILASAIGVPTYYPENEPALAHGALLNSIDQVNSLEIPDIAKSPRVQHALETMRILRKYFAKEVYLRGNCDQAPFSLASMVRTPSEFMLDLILDSENVINLLNKCSIACIRFVDLMAEAGADMISNGDSPAGPEMIAPELYRTFALPYERMMTEAAHTHGLPYCLHICGNTDVILTDLPETKSDAIELDYKTDTSAIYKTFHNKIALFGTLDPSGVIANGTTALVAKKAREILKIYRNSPRFIMNAGCAIPPTTPSKNIFKLVEVTRSFI
jgi:uroporphyrinogen decarboxylase